jgi:hypothetical protein
MGWEQRGKKQVYYRKERDPLTGRVRSIYCGSGERGELAAREDEERRGSTRGGVTDIRTIKKRVTDMCHVKKEASEGAEIRTEKKAPSALPVELAQVSAKKEAGELQQLATKKESSLNLVLKREPITLEEVRERASRQQAGAYRAGAAARMFAAGNIAGACALAGIDVSEQMARNVTY